MAGSLFDQRPERLSDQGDPEQCLEELLAMEQISAVQAETLDYALLHWIVQVVSRPGDLEAVHLLDRLIVTLSDRRKGSNHDGGEMRPQVRLEVYREILDLKARFIESRQSGRAHRLVHTRKILSLLGKGAQSPSLLAEELGVTPGRISQILAVLEEAGLVLRERLGRDSLVRRATYSGVELGGHRAMDQSLRPGRPNRDGTFGGGRVVGADARRAPSQNPSSKSRLVALERKDRMMATSREAKEAGAPAGGAPSVRSNDSRRGGGAARARRAGRQFHHQAHG